MIKKQYQNIEPEKIQFINMQAEQKLLGAIIINNNYIEQIIEFLKADHFYLEIHQEIYKSIISLNQENSEISSDTLETILETNCLYQQINGNEYIIKIVALGKYTNNINVYGHKIYDLALKRNLSTFAKNIIDNINNTNHEQSATKQIDLASEQLYLLINEGVLEKEALLSKDLVPKYLEYLNKIIKSSDYMMGISTGLTNLDYKISGFQNSDLIILAGRPSMGKTAFAVNFAFNACKELQRKTIEGEKPSGVGWFSLEMSSEQVITRFLMMMGQISIQHLNVDANMREKLNECINELKQMPLYIDDTPALTISALKARARKLKNDYNVGIIFIDHLHLLRSNNNSSNRMLEVSEVVMGLKSLAKELDIPIIAIAQLSRAVESRENRQPILTDLRDSGTIEEIADLILFIYRHEYYLAREEPDAMARGYAEWIEECSKNHNFAEIIIAKHRNGSLGTIRLLYEARFSKISDLKI